MSPTALCHWPCKTPESLLVSSCSFLQATIHTTKKETQETADINIYSKMSFILHQWKQTGAKSSDITDNTIVHIYSPHFLHVFFFTAPVYELYS